MEELKYIIEDSTIAQLLGVHNFTNEKSAILELVKNAYDAQATKLDIIFEDNKLVVKDNGVGMNSDDIKNHWMHIGKSEKGYETKDINNQKRVLAGSKGIGRFALSRLGTNVQLFSQKKNQKNSVLWTTDWNKSLLQERNALDACGTTIIINGLRDRWNNRSADKLVYYLSRTYNDDLMKINIYFGSEVKSVYKYFVEPKLGYNCSSTINIKYNSVNASLECTINSDEFKIEAKEYSADLDLYSYKKIVNCLDELTNYKDIPLSRDELDLALKELGDFSADFYFSTKVASSADMEKFLYKYRVLPEKYDNGVILYRNSFSISSYDGSKDWLGLGKRSRKSPAAATHPTGSWRVRENQLAGKVQIDKKSNEMLGDLSNRQGLVENTHYHIFIKIIEKGIAEFERYRQLIIRKINKKNSIAKEKEEKLTELIIKNPNILRKISEKDVDRFVSELKDQKREISDSKKEVSNTEARYKYDIRILNVLATSGLKASSIAHEMHNDRNSVSENYDNIIDAMKSYGIWDMVNDSEKTKYAFSNIPELLRKNKRVNSKLVTFMDTMLAEVEKNNFLVENHNILDLLEDIKNVWERDYTWVKIKIDVSPAIHFVFPEDTLRVIFDNLILNSIQHNDVQNRVSIFIDAILNDGLLGFSYRDDGRGLDPKYIDDPFRILEVHESSRKQGHGLGMWILNNTVVMSGGNINNIKGTNGFSIQFTLGGKFSGEN